MWSKALVHSPTTYTAVVFVCFSKQRIPVAVAGGYAHYPQRGLNLKICVFPIFLQKPLNHIKKDHLNNWRDLFEKKHFFSLCIGLTNVSRKYISISYWPEILAPGLKSIFRTTLFQLLSFLLTVAELATSLKWGKGNIFALLAQNHPNSAKTVFSGPKIPPIGASWT